ncbi:hypothetical protein [Streptomyces colonosanans]|uniref:Uncharacterized protein n=1 Tax=Streptomyces colonosanans TaxID=1428652 RepID=A0A1S2Q4T6_9ACTN|nr:hypothetical protein [Streptomyces colonosanans]OIK01150.1 hypothetical protein BIV24_01595 [Streptomyces colonosanans]
MNEQTFADLAGELMRSALDSWRTGNRRFAVFHAGLGCEHALKALLAHRNPLLVADSQTDQALRFRALGLDDSDGVKPLTEARTISMERAFKDAAIFMQGRMPVTKQQFDPLVQSRNGLTHLAWYNTKVTKQAVTTGIAVAEAVRAELGIPPAVFWGGYETVFNELTKVTAMPSLAGPLPTLEAAAETLAQQEAEHARRAVATAAIVARHTANLGSSNRTDDDQMAIAQVAGRTALWTALQTTGMRAQGETTALLEAYGLLPLAPRPDRIHGPSPAMYVRAHDAVVVKALVSSSVYKAFADACKEHNVLREALPSILIRNGRTVFHPNQCQTFLYWVECHACERLANVYGRKTRDFFATTPVSGNTSVVSAPTTLAARSLPITPSCTTVPRAP